MVLSTYEGYVMRGMYTVYYVMQLYLATGDGFFTDITSTRKGKEMSLLKYI